MKTEILLKLAEPFPVDAISWRVGSMSKDKTKARALAYLDARDVMDRLDDVCCADWECEYLPMTNGTACCRIGIFIDGRMRWRSNGAGATDIEGEKGQYSDAFKRAAVLWGIGRYLYSLDSPWVKLDEWKQIEKDELPRLRALLERNGKPQSTPSQARKDGEYPRLEALLRAALTLEDLQMIWRENQRAITALPDSWQRKLGEEKDRLKAALTVKASS